MQNELKFALDAVAQACALTRAIQQETISTVFSKEDRSPVTMADYSSQLLVTHLLQQSFPGMRLVGEENIAALSQGDPGILQRISGYLARAIPGYSLEMVAAQQEQLQGLPPSNRFWVLDPIDGTKGFLRGEQYAVALALMEDGEPVLGVIGCPNLDLYAGPASGGPGILAFAVRGNGAWIQAAGAQEPRRLSVSGCTDPARAQFVASVESGHSDNDEIQDLKAHLGNNVPDAHFDSQAKYVMVAAGRFDVFFRLPPRKRPDYHEKIWDHAAGALLVQEAGGVVTDIHGRPFDFSIGAALDANYGVVVSNGFVHTPIINFFTGRTRSAA